MTNSEFIKKVSECEIDKKKLSKLEKTYGVQLPEIIGKIVSYASNPVFLEEYRVLSFDEICEAKNELNVDFTGMQIIPIMDCGDNDFIVYHCKSMEWSKFNIIDECIFKRNASFNEMLK